MLQFPSILLQSIHQWVQQSSFIGLQKVRPKVSSHSLRQSDPHQWFVATTQATIFPPHPLLCSETLGWRAVAGGSYQVVTAGAMGHSAMTGINETRVGDEIAKLWRGSQNGGLPGIHAVTASLPQTWAGAAPVCTTDQRSQQRQRGPRHGSCAISFVVSGTPSTPRGVRFMARKDICQAVYSSPAGFHWKDKYSL